MLFNSLHFLIFFPVVTAAYFMLPTLRARNMMLLVASYYFYMQYKPEYAILMLISTLIDYLAANGMAKAKDNKAYKNFCLCMSLVGNLGMLFFFKYFNFFNRNVATLLSFFNVPYQPLSLDILLPVGISFYTFQTLSYTIDVYRGDIEAERDFFTFALYVSFFPQLVAGPIERSTNLLPQFYRYYDFDAKRVSSGLRLMLFGFFKKVVIADRLAVIVNTVYNNYTSYNGVYYIIAAVAFAYQIFCDFSGYSDIARGCARIMGFELMVNFERPYYSKSVTEFWRRWHISLSTWFRDYLYIPLGGSRKGYIRTLLNLFIVFLVSGLWHGASWTFVVWGALNGIAIVFEKIVGIGKRAGKKDYMEKKALERHQKPFYIRLLSFAGGLIPLALTFVFINFTWVFFRAQTLEQAFYMLPRFLEGLNAFNLKEFLSTRMILGLDYWEFFTAIISVGLLELVHLFQSVASPSKVLGRMPAIARLAVYAFCLSLVIWLAWTESQTFIYFAF
ncbi:MAG: MBOAT family protein [Clostridiaceae bacterium]|nr:MBOAT family protein [Clostridiaceae bacterium]